MKRIRRPINQLSTSPGDACHIPCESNFAVVCDQNGNLYQNACVFNVAQCLNPQLVQSRNTCGSDDDGHPIIPADPGPPPGMTPSSNALCSQYACGDTVDPVCDVRGTTYMNKCAHERFSCMYPSLNTALIPCAPWQIDQASGR